MDGDQAALEEVVGLLRDPLYRLALRMVWRPADAEDATQEILIRVITRLASWRAEAKLLTWAYRIGVNYLLNLRRKTPQEAQPVSLEDFRNGLADGLADADYAGPDAGLLAEEVRLSCTQAVLQCLERGERVAFVLGGIFELPSAEAAWILDVTPAAYRKRLERARQRLRAFMDSTCGIVNPEAFCRCARRVDKATAIGRIDPRRPAWPPTPSAPRDVTWRRPSRSCTGCTTPPPCSGPTPTTLPRAPGPTRLSRCCAPAGSRSSTKPRPALASPGQVVPAPARPARRCPLPG